MPQDQIIVISVLISAAIIGILTRFIMCNEDE